MGIVDEFLSQNVLVLNRLWQAVNICSAKRAFCLLYSGHAQVVDSSQGTYQTFNFEEWMLASEDESANEHVARTVNFSIKVPRIIVLMVFDRLPKKEVKLTRSNVFERDDYTCQYCGKQFDRKHLNIDHVVPRDKGGKTTWENVVSSCIPCNTRKGNKLPHEVNMPLLRKPKRPKLRPFVHITFSHHHHESWKHFLDLSAWKVDMSD
ncbi:MAG: HNH endonuclease [Verrucomicrobiota bacterium]